MTTAADLLLTNGRIHPLTDGHDPRDDEPVEAVAVRDGRIIRLDSAYEVEFLAGVEAEVIDLEGRTLLPGFVDAHTHMEVIGQYEREADLTGADSPEACLDRLRSLREGPENDGGRDEEWLLGFGYDESTWGGDYLTRDQLDEVSTDRPVVAYREDMHVASVNSVVLDRLRDEMPEGDVRTAGGEPTGVLVEDAVTAVRDATGADPDRTREYLAASHGWSDADETALREAADAEVEAAVGTAETAESPTPDAMFDRVFAERPPRYDRQRAAVPEEPAVDR